MALETKIVSSGGGSGLIFTGSGWALALYFGLLFYAGLKISLKK
jgi:hypothetical protein